MKEGGAKVPRWGREGGGGVGRWADGKYGGGGGGRARDPSPTILLLPVLPPQRLKESKNETARPPHLVFHRRRCLPWGGRRALREG